MTKSIQLRTIFSLFTGISLTACGGPVDPEMLGSGGAQGAGAGGALGTGGVLGTGTGGTLGAGGALGTGGAPGTGGAIGTGTGGAIGTGGTDLGEGSGGGGDVPASGYPENTSADCDVTFGALKANPKLPNPFAMHDGTLVTTKEGWKCRRAEIIADMLNYEIGPKPEPPMVEATFNGGKLDVSVTVGGNSITLSSTVGAGADCVAIGMNGNSSLISGCTQIPFMHDQVVSYNNGGAQKQSDPFYKLYPELWGKAGSYAAWSWGISRLIDGIEQVKDQLKVDPTRIGVHGCSYAGKMALFGGAFDERVALTVAQESGGGGITSWRTSQDFTTRTGTNVEKIDNTNGSWFLPSMMKLDPYSLPHDHHELIAMIAPRALIALGNKDYEWLGDESGWKSINAAKEVWKSMGAAENIGFDFTSDHNHCAAAPAQVASVKTFVDKFLKGQAGDTEIVTPPPSGGGFDLSTTSAIDWTTPTLQ